MTKTRTTDQLIAEAEATEAALLALWDDLKGRLPETSDITQKLSESGEGLRKSVQAAASSATSTAKAHPIAAVALGAGLAWLLLGRRPTASKTAEEATAEAAEAWKSRAIAARNAAQQRLKDQIRALRSEAGQVADDLAETGVEKLTDARKLAREKATITADLARDLSEAFSHGLADLGHEAKARILAAREKSFQSMVTGGATPETLWEKGQAAARRHPIGTAALGLAAGAGVALMVPRSRAALRAAAPNALGAVITPAAALLAQNLMARASRLLDPLLPDAEPETAEDSAEPVAQPSVKDVAKAAAVAGVAKAVGEAIGKAGAERASKAMPAKAGGVEKGATKGDADDALPHDIKGAA